MNTDNNNAGLTEKPNGTGLTRVLKATKCSLLGLKAAYQYESAFRQEFWLCVILLPLAWFITPSLPDFFLLTAVMLFVLVVEIINSAVEAVVDRVGLERHILSGRAKDLGSAAVMLALTIAGLVWASYLVKYFSI